MIKISSRDRNIRDVRFLFLALILVCCGLNSRAANLNFEHIGLKEGLSHNSVAAIAQDSLGLMWFGTRNGLNKYDGNTITTYYAERGKLNSLPENQIKNIKSVGSKLWIQTFGALSCYDIINETFVNHRVPEIKSFEPCGSFTWIGTSEGLYKLCHGEDSLRMVNTGLPRGTEYKALLRTPKGLLLGTQKGVYIYSPDEHVLKNLIPEISTTEFFADSRNLIWVGSMSDGAFRIDAEGGVKHYAEGVISHNFVRCIAEDDEGNIWLGTLLGLDRLDINTDTAKNYRYDEGDPSQMSHSSVWSIFKDRRGTMWIGTYFGGVNVFHPTDNTFRYYPVNTANHTGLNFRVVSQMSEDSSGNLWICTEGAGLNHYNRKTGYFTYYSHVPGDRNTISCNNVKSVVNQGDTILWLATHTGGLNMFEVKKKKFSTFKNRPSHRVNIPGNNIGQIIPYGNRYIMCTHNGVMVFDPSTKDVLRLLPERLHAKLHNNILAVMLNGDELWIGSEFVGLARYNLSTGEFRQYSFDATDVNGISSDLVNSIYLDRFGRIWIATSNGLDLYRPATDDFEHFSTGDGLPGNIVLNMTDSRYEDLLITTNRGISVFNYSRRRFTNQTQDNGLPLNEINANSLFVSSGGEVFLGGFNGMVSFNEEKLLWKNPVNKIHVTEARVNNRSVSPADGNGMLELNIMTASRIDLGPKHTILTLAFSDMGMTKNYNRELAYKLEGFDKEWLPAGASNRATYTNLSPGTYKFKVKYMFAPEGEPSEAGLTVKVHPPLYKTMWAFMLYALIIASVVLFLNRMYLLRRRAEYELTLKDTEHKREVEYNQSKLRFFTNVSHEFRTPLTLIAGQLEYLLENRLIPPNVYKRILSASKNTRRLQSMINELLDFRKQETGYGNIHVSENDFREFLHEIFLSYIELADHSKIKYEFHAPDEPVKIWFDRELMEKVFYNLLSNAFKFTSGKGEISVSLTEYSDEIKVVVEDNGEGIPPESVDKIFDRFYQAENSYGRKQNNMQGTGLGLALAKYIVEAHGGTISVRSMPKKGSAFTVTLRKDKSHFTDEQIGGFGMDGSEKMVTEQLDELATMINDITSEERVKTYTLLIVEDNDEMRDFLAEILSPLYHVETAADGMEGIEKASKVQPNLILSDVMMPNMSGTEMCVRLKNDFATSHIPVILLTARTATEYKVEGLQTGADDYITKPFSVKLLVARIDNILKNRRALQEKFRSDPDADTAKLALNDLDAEFITKARECVMRNIDNIDYSVNAFASDMLMGRTSLFLKIKGITEQTPNEFMLSVRLKHAVHIMYTDPRVTVSEIAYKCGFSSQQYFNTCFKKHFGVPPGQYMQERTKS